jgi:hypothetical protein
LEIKGKEVFNKYELTLIINEKPTKCANDIYFPNLLHLHVRTYLTTVQFTYILDISTQLFNSLILTLIVNIQHNDWILDNIFTSRYILDE